MPQVPNRPFKDKEGWPCCLNDSIALPFDIPKFRGGQSEKWRLNIASPSEPGDRLLVSGTVFASDGVTPVEGVIVYIYHTDAEGYYHKVEDKSRSPRLHGTMHTGKDGRYEFATRRPAPYPGGNNPAHIHFVIRRDTQPEQGDDGVFRCNKDIRLKN